MKTPMKLDCCTACPRACQVNRLNGERGFCQAGSEIQIALAAPHFGEEPCISGEKGSGAVFFSHCNLNCLFCQNHPISAGGQGREMKDEQVIETMRSLVSQGVHNLNLVSPTQYLPQLLPILKEIKPSLGIPIVYNTNGYESVEALKALEGLVDIYLPDLKYSRDKLGVEYSRAPGYFRASTLAILEMRRQVGAPQYDDAGLMQRGLLVRHLVLPGAVDNSKGVLDWLALCLEGIPLSLMAQYTPIYQALEHPILGRPLLKQEYEEVLRYAEDLGIDGFMQSLDAVGEEAIPEFRGGKETAR